MSAVTSHCFRCGSLVESDCDFCPNCGAPKQRPTIAPPPPSSPHSWMATTPHQEVPAPYGGGAPNQVAPVNYPQSYSQNSPQTQSLDHGANTARTMGIIVISLMVIGLIPCLGWLNYITLLLGFITVIISIVAVSGAKSIAAKNSALIGLTFALIAGFVGFLRLLIGGGCL